MTSPTRHSGIIADAPPTNWVDRHAPGYVKPYLKLARFDRPIGAWLLLFPCWWGQALGHHAAGDAFPNLWFVVLFVIGAFVMRGAGCTWNDIVDRNYDGRVERTALRPIPSGQVSVRQALIFAIALSLVGLLVLVQFNAFTIWLAIASLALVAAYPFSKRYTYWPQVVLGLTFKWGALVGWAAIHAGLSFSALLLYAGCVCWTIGYDTIYAHQDKDDDALLGLKSTALRFGDTTPSWLSLFYGAAMSLWTAAALSVGTGLVFALALLLIAGHFVWQINTIEIDDPDNCLSRFRANQWVGWVFFLGVIGDMAVLNGTT